MILRRAMILRALATLGLLLLPSVADAALSVNRIAPIWIAPGTTKNIVITGTGFSGTCPGVTCPTVTMGTGITVNTVAVDSATQITANVTAAGGATTATRNVRVTLADTSFFQRDGLLAVSEAFTLKGTTGGSGFATNERQVFSSLSYIVDQIVGMDQEATTYGYTAATTTSAQRAAYITRTATSIKKAAVVNALLLHADRSSTAPALNSTGVGASPGTRAQWVAAATTAWAELGTELTALSNAILVLENATSDICTAPTVCAQSQLNRARTIRVDAAIAVHAATNFALPYATPYPDDITVGSSVVRVIPQVAAVHGDYRMAQWALYREQHMVGEVFDHLATIINAGQVDATAVNQIFGRGLLAYADSFKISLAVSQHPDFVYLAPSGRPGMNPRFNIAVEGSDLLMDRGRTEATVFRLNEMMANGVTQWVVTGPTALTAYGEMMKAVSGEGGAWQMNDQAAWALIFFNQHLIPTSIAQAGDRQGEVLVTTGRYSFLKMEPASLRPGTSMTVTITGDTPDASTCAASQTRCGFENGVLPAFSTSVGSTGTQGVTVTSASVVSATQIQARITAAADATPGLRDITLTPPAQVGGTPTAVVAALAVGTELSLKGGLTTPERAALQNIYDGTVHVMTAMRTARVALGAAGVSQAQMYAIVFPAANLIEDLFKGTGYLIHAENKNGGPAAGFLSEGFDSESFPGEPRSTWVHGSRFHIDRTRGTNVSGDNGGFVNHTLSIQTALTAAIAAATDPAVDTALTTARDTHLAAAITKLNAVDMTLSFATPWPDDTVGTSGPSVVHNGLQCFTSHGGMASALHGHGRGCNYVFEAGEASTTLVRDGVFILWTGIQGYFDELYSQFPQCLDQWATMSGHPIRTINPPPGAVFAQMNPRMAGVAEMWDIQTNVVDLSGSGFLGGATSINASFGRQTTKLADLFLQMNLDAPSSANLRTMVGKMVDSWRNHGMGLAHGMDWSFAAPRAPTTRTLSALPSTAPAITSANSTSAQTGQAMVPFVVLTTGTTGAGPTVPAITVQSGTLPTGITLTDNANGTATISGTPSSSTAIVTLRASNGTGSPADQSFTLTVAGSIAPTITTRNTHTFTVGKAGTFTVRASPTTTVTLSKTGALPTGVTFTDNLDGTATITGTPSSATPSSFAIVITAANGTLPNGTQNFTLNVQTAARRGGGKGKLTIQLRQIDHPVVIVARVANALLVVAVYGLAAAPLIILVVAMRRRRGHGGR